MPSTYEGLETSRDVTNVVQTRWPIDQSTCAEMQWLDLWVLEFKAPEAKIQEYRGMGMDGMGTVNWSLD